MHRLNDEFSLMNCCEKAAHNDVERNTLEFKKVAFAVASYTFFGGSSSVKKNRKTVAPRPLVRLHWLGTHTINKSLTDWHVFGTSRVQIRDQLLDARLGA